MNTSASTIDRAVQERWLKRYYFTRAAFSIAWILAALGPGRQSPFMASLLLVMYPAWDALANLADGSRSGGLARNRSQAFNVLVSLAVAGAVAVSLPDMHRVLAVFGAWAILSGLLQLGAALGRWKTAGAQWAMALSGAQSALAGAFFIYQAGMPAMPSIATVVGYAGFGAFYFLVSALWLSTGGLRRKSA
jgi:cation transport ATPase